MRKKVVCALIVLIPVMTIAVILLCRNTNYEIDYKLKNFNIKEKYYSERKLYYFETSYMGNNYEIAINSAYIGRELINDIEVLSEDDTTCMYFKSNKLSTYPVCTKGKELISHDIINLGGFEDFMLEEKTVLNKKYKNIKLNTVDDERILIWNHFGYYHITKNSFKEIKLFKNELYQDQNSFQVDKYIIVPDYDQKYEFNKFYIINIDAKSVDELIFDGKISFNYYYMGSIDNKGYIFDKKNMIEYEIIPSRSKIEIVSKGDYGKIWRDKWEEISLVKLKNNEYTFDSDLNFNYIIKDNKMYCKYYKSMKNVLVSENVDEVIYSNEEKVYYITNGRLFAYSPYIKKYELIEYDEISFNKGLTIYIY